MRPAKPPRAIVFLWLLLICGLFPLRAALAEAPAHAEAARLHALFDEEWEWTLKEFPEYATRVGDNRYNNKVADLSAPAMERRKAHERELLQRIGTIDRTRLTGQDVVSYDLFRREAERSVAQQRFPMGKIVLSGGFIIPYEWEPVSQMHGVHLDVPSLPRSTPFRNAKDYRDFIARLNAYPRQIDEGDTADAARDRLRLGAARAAHA